MSKGKNRGTGHNPMGDKTSGTGHRKGGIKMRAKADKSLDRIMEYRDKINWLLRRAGIPSNL